MFHQISESESPMLLQSMTERGVSEDFYDDQVEENDQVSLSPDYNYPADSALSFNTDLLSNLSCLSDLFNESQMTTQDFDKESGEINVCPLNNRNLGKSMVSWPEKSMQETLDIDGKCNGFLRKRKLENGEDDDVKSPNKAAIQAKLNREKKKKYIKALEEENNELRKENLMLKSKEKKFEMTLSVLKKEALYLRSVLENESQLAKILKNLNQPVRLTRKFKMQNTVVEDHDNRKSKKRKIQSSGICLHVKNDEVTMEFCRQCSELSNLYC